MSQGIEYTYTPNARQGGQDNSITDVYIEEKPYWLLWDGTTLSGSPGPTDVGTGTGENGAWKVKLRISQDGNIVYQEFLITVINVNDAPTFTNSPNATVDEDIFYSYTPTINDYDGDTCEITCVTDLTNSWLGWDGTELSGTPDNDHVGSYNIELKVSEVSNPSSSSSLNWTITVNNTNDAPNFTTTPNATIDEALSVSINTIVHQGEPNGKYFYFDVSRFNTVFGSLTNEMIADVLVERGNTIIFDGQCKFWAAGYGTKNVNSSENDWQIGDQMYYNSSTYEYRYIPNAEDVDNTNDTVTITCNTDLTNSWLKWNSTDEELYGIPLNANAGNSFNITLIATDNHGDYTEQTFSITVQNKNNYPVLLDSPWESVYTGTDYSYTPTVYDSDINETLTIDVTSKPNWLTWNQGILSGKPLPEHVGTEQISIEISDGTVTVVRNFTLNIILTSYVDGELQSAVNDWINDPTERQILEDTYGPISNWNVSQVTSMSNLFKDKSFNEDISGWDVSKVSAMNGMFRNSTFNQDISGWTVSNVVNMSWMFQANSSFNQNLTSWTTTKVQNLSYMFQSATAFNGQIDGWDTSKVITMERMFHGATVFNQPINNWVLSSLTDINHIFVYAENFNQHLNNWDVSKVTYMRGVFYQAISFNQPLNNWNVSSVTNIRGMFDSADVFNQDISNWNVVNVDENDGGWTSFGNLSGHSEPLFTGNNPYYFVVKRTPLDNSNIQTAVDSALNNGNSLDEYGGHISNWHVSNVTDMSYLFQSKADFDEDLGNWDVSNVTTMTRMFRYAYSFNNGGSDNIKNWNLASLGSGGLYQGMDIFQDTSFNQDISAWTFHHEIHLGGLFLNTPFNQDISGWNVSNATAMSYMFANSPFNQDISGWDVSKVTGIGNMFKDNDDFDQDISGWNVSNVTTGFSYASQGTNHSEPAFNDSSEYYFTIKQETISQSNIQTAVNDWDENGSNKYKYGKNIATWDTSAVTNMSELFKDKTNLFGHKINFVNVQNLSVVDSQSYMTTNFGNISPQFTMNGAAVSNNMSKDTQYGPPSDGITIWGAAVSPTSDPNLGGFKFISDVNGICEIRYGAAWIDWTVAAAKISLNGNVIYSTRSTSTIETFTVSIGDEILIYEEYSVLNLYTVYLRRLESIISNWDVSNVTDMSGMFYGVSSFNEPIGNWNVSNVTNMNGTFYNASAFNQTLGLNNFGTGDDLPANFGSMTIPVHNVTCSVDLWAYYEPNKIIIYNYTEGSHGRFALITMNGTYENNSSRLIVGGGTTVYNTRDELIDGYTTATAGSYSNEHSFESGTGFNNITVTNGWDVSKVTNMTNTFRNTSAFNQPIGSWNVSSVYKMDYMFNSSAFNQPLGNNFGTGDDLPANYGHFTNASGNHTISYWAYNPSYNDLILATTEISVGYLQFVKITLAGEDKSLTSAYKAFSTSATLSSQQELLDIFNNANFYTDDQNWFTKGAGFDDITFSNGWDVSSVTTFNNMFHSNTSFNQNISKWNVSSATNIEHMFRYASAFNQDISDWDVSNVTMGFYDNNYGHGSGHSVSIFRGIINHFRDDSHGSLYNFTANYDLLMTSTMASPEVSSLGWSNQNMHFQTKFNNHSRVDFRFKNDVSGEARFCVGLTKEDFGSVGKSLISAKDYYGVGNSTYFQIHNNWMHTYAEDGNRAPTTPWTVVASKAASNETICSIICSDYWEENPFGNDPTNIGNILALSNNSHATSWGLGEDGDIILELRGSTDGYNYYLKIDKQGNMVNGSSRYKGGIVTTQGAPTSLSDLISRYGNGNTGHTFSFTKDANFPMPKIIKYVMDGTLEHETPTDYTGKFYIAALINGPGSIEFFPNSGTYFGSNFSGTPPSTISFTAGGWGTSGHSYIRSTYTNNSVRYDLKFNTGSLGSGHALVFSINNNQLILDVNDATHGFNDPISFKINGTLASNPDVVSAGDIIDLVNNDGSYPATFIVPNELAVLE